MREWEFWGVLGATPHQEKGPYRQKELWEALGGGLKGEKGAEMAWVHLAGLAAGHGMRPRLE